MTQGVSAELQGRKDDMSQPTSIPADAAPCDVRDGWCVTHNTASELVTDHTWQGIWGHPDDPECGVCHEPVAAHVDQGEWAS